VSVCLLLILDFASDLSDEGMPSNHSQFIAYFCTIYIIQFLFRCKDLHIFFRILYTFYVFILGVLVCYSRYYLGCHHPEQVRMLILGLLLRHFLIDLLDIRWCSCWDFIWNPLGYSLYILRPFKSNALDPFYLQMAQSERLLRFQIDS
jgi:membrane-associated phospholipid phosphatase